MSEPLFRFVLTRPAAQVDSKLRVVALAQDSAFQGALKQAGKADGPLQALRTAATDFTNGPNFVKDPSSTPLAASLSTLSSNLDKLQLYAQITAMDLTKAVTEGFGKAPSAVVADKAYTTTVSNLKDSLLAIKQLQELHSLPVEALSNQLRDLDFISQVATANTSDLPSTGAQLSVLRRRPLQTDLYSLKSLITDRALISGAQSVARETVASRNEKIQGLVSSIENYRSAISELTSINGSHIVSMAQTSIPGSTVPDALTPQTVFLRQANLLSKLSDISTKYLDPSSSSSSLPNPPAPPIVVPKLEQKATVEATSGVIPSTDPNALAAVSHFADLAVKAPGFVSTGTTAFKPIDKSAKMVKLSAEKIKTLSEVTNGVLTKENVSLSTIGVDTAVRQIKSTLVGNISTLKQLANPGLGANVSLMMVGGTLISTVTPISSIWGGIFGGGQFWPPFVGLTGNTVPQVHGTVSASGVADLLVVKQQLKAYEGADVSSIQNVLKSESRSNEHTTTRTTTSVTATQTETTDQETRDLESTSRFEMSKETDNQIKSDQSLKAGVNISASYGPTVSLSASVEGSMSSSQQTSTKAASSFSQDITEKGSKTITTQVLQSSSLTVTDSVVDTDKHAFDNTAGTANISGVYQWATKVYQAQVFNYGLRVMYDFMIPEPGSFLIEVYKQAQAVATKLNKPIDLAIGASDLDEFNYDQWVAAYGATDVVPPPDEFKTYAKEMSMPPSTDSNTNFNKTDEIALDPGYSALSCSVTCDFNWWDKDTASVDVGVGQYINRFNNSGSWTWQSSMADENGNIPVWMETWKVSLATVGIEVTCLRTNRAWRAWQLDTFGKLWNAYRARLQEYNDAVAQLQLNAGVTVAGQDPDTNLKTMRTEVKKNCISILTDQHFDSFGAIDTSSTFPQIDITMNASQGPYVRFFEQAFEWEEMTWLTYPYYWGRKALWADRLTGVSISESDPVFQDFLQAGYCRAVAPVRPGFETAVDHWLKYGELWNGGPLPPITDGLYVPIANEIAERLGKPDGEIPQGDPWEVRIPTTLIKLRKDDLLPVWTQQSDGTWKSNDP